MDDALSPAPSVVSNIYRLFVNRADSYLGWHTHWVMRRRQLTPDLVSRALTEPFPLGVLAVSGIGTSRWTCFEVDEDDRLPALIDLNTGLPEMSRLFERSRRGAHVWLFHQPISWKLASVLGLSRARDYGLEGIEVYPRHGGFNAVRLPGTVHPKTGKRYPFIDPKTANTVPFADALEAIRPLSINVPAIEVASPRATPIKGTVDEFETLVSALGELTAIHVYGEQRASGVCPWHDDEHPSLYVRGRRFHCLACLVFGDVHDVRRYQRKGILPPH